MKASVCIEKVKRMSNSDISAFTVMLQDHRIVLSHGMQVAQKKDNLTCKGKEYFKKVEGCLQKKRLSFLVF